MGTNPIIASSATKDALAPIGPSCPQASFLGLPVETRSKIYQHLFSHDALNGVYILPTHRHISYCRQIWEEATAPAIEKNYQGPPLSSLTSILLACRCTLDEAHDVFYEKVRFVVTHRAFEIDFITSLQFPNTCAGAVRTLELQDADILRNCYTSIEATFPRLESLRLVYSSVDFSGSVIHPNTGAVTPFNQWVIKQALQGYQKQDEPLRAEALLAGFLNYERFLDSENDQIVDGIDGHLGAILYDRQERIRQGSRPSYSLIVVVMEVASAARDSTQLWGFFDPLKVAAVLEPDTYTWRIVLQGARYTLQGMAIRRKPLYYKGVYNSKGIHVSSHEDWPDGE